MAVYDYMRIPPGGEALRATITAMFPPVSFDGDYTVQSVCGSYSTHFNTTLIFFGQITFVSMGVRAHDLRQHAKIWSSRFIRHVMWQK